MATRWLDHILGPDTTANRPDPLTVPDRALYADTDDGVLYINDDGTWAVYRTPATGLADPTTTVGDLLVRGSTTVSRFPAGANGTVFMADSAQSLGVKYKALDDSDVAPVAPNDQTGTSYVFVLADARRLVTGNNAGGIVFTIPPNSSVGFLPGAVLQWYQKGAGQIQVVGGSGVTVRTPHGTKTSVQFAVVTAIQVATDDWVVTGDTTT